MRMKASLPTGGRLSSAKNRWLPSCAGRGYKKFILFGRSEEHSGGREKNSILCDICESVLGAMYLDGGIEPAGVYVERIVQVAEDEAPIKKSQDYKTELQIFLQKDGEADLQYQVLRTEGPPHDTTFMCGLSLKAGRFQKGKGNLRSAQSRRLLERL